MAQVYKIDNKRYEFLEIDSAVQTSYLVSEANYNTWLKVKTDDSSVNIQLPLGLSDGFRCIIENTGVFTINYVNEAGTSIATQQDKFTEDQFRTIEAVYDNSVWRLQGYIGRQDLSSLYDVNVNAGGLPEDGDALVYDINFNSWRAGKNVPYIPADPFFLDHIIVDEDHGKTLLFDTTAAPITVTFNLGLEDGFYCTVVNVGTGTLNVATAGTLNAAGTTLSQYQSMNVLHAASNILYGVIADGIGGTGGAGGGGGYAAGNYFDTFIATSYTGLFPETHETNSNSLAIGTLARSFEDDQIVIGSNATADGINDIALGNQADCDGNGQGKIAIGRLSSASAAAAISIGASSNATGTDTVAIGTAANALSSSSFQLGGGTNNEPSTLNFFNAKIAHSFGLNIKREDAENTVTTTHRFAEEVTDGGVAQHPTLASIAISFPNKQLYIGTGTADSVGQPWKQWAPISSRPDLDFIRGDYSDDIGRQTTGVHYYQPGVIQPLWARTPDGYLDNLNKEQWVALEWLDSTQLGSNAGSIIYRRHYQNEPYFRLGIGDEKFTRWVVQTNVNGLSNVSNGPFSVPAADLTSFSSLLEEGDRVLFSGQSDSTQNGIYRFDTFDGSFYIFNRPQDLQLSTVFGNEDIRVWGDSAGEGTWKPTTIVNVGDAITFTFIASTINVEEGALYFITKASGNYLVNVRLMLRTFITPTNPDARGTLTLRKVDINTNQDQIEDQFTFNLFSKNSSGDGVLKDIRLSETMTLTNSIYYFTLALYDVPETYLYTLAAADTYPSSYITISPTQLFEATR